MCLLDNALSKPLRRQLAKSLRNEGEPWWTGQHRETDKVAPSIIVTNVADWFEMWKPNTSKMVRESHDSRGSGTVWLIQFDSKSSTYVCKWNNTGRYQISLRNGGYSRVGYMKRHKVIGPDGLFPSLYKNGKASGLVLCDGPVSIGGCTNLQANRPLCESHRGINLAFNASKLVADTILFRFI